MPPKVQDLSGKVFSRLTVLRFSHMKNRLSYWICQCLCGEIITPSRPNLISGNTVSCGCYNLENITTHGLTHSREYTSWAAMKQRCANPKKENYPHYGGRGITVYPAWVESFECFLKHLGPRPLGTTLDRVDVNGNYEPGNVRWATSSEQNANKRRKV